MSKNNDVRKGKDRKRQTESDASFENICKLLNKKKYYKIFKQVNKNR